MVIWNPFPIYLVFNRCEPSCSFLKTQVQVTEVLCKWRRNYRIAICSTLYFSAEHRRVHSADILSV